MPWNAPRVKKMIPKLAKKVLGISLQSTSSLKFTGNATGLVWHAKLHHIMSAMLVLPYG